MTGSGDEGWGSVFSDLEVDEAPSGPLPDRDADSDAEEPTDPTLIAPGLGARLRPPSRAKSAPPGPPPPGPPAPTAFREAELLQTLDGPTGSARDWVPPDAPSGWREYRELIVTAAVGCVALVAAVTWGRWSAAPSPSAAPPREAPKSKPGRAAPVERPRAPARRPPNRAEPSAPPPMHEPRGTSNPLASSSAGPEQRPAERKPAKLPMLTVVSQPSGALVRIDGVVYGRTPLIMQAPTDRQSFDVELRLDEHRPWSGRVQKDDAGHFSINTALEPVEP